MPSTLKRYCFLLFIICVLSFSTAYTQNNSSYIGIKTVVIDAGHGGKDAGAISKNRKLKEKDIALSIALKLGNLIKEQYPNIKVIYTRSRDIYVELNKRAEIANKNRADLFISIHVNSTKATSPRGCETFVMGTHKSESNFEICKTENSVIVLEDDYKSKYEGFDPNSPESYIIFSLLQNTHLEQSLKLASYVQDEYKKGPVKINRGVKQGGLLVLWKATMPAILTEVGFISNSSEALLLSQAKNQNAIAGAIFKAFQKYKSSYEINIPNLSQNKEEKTKNQEKESIKRSDSIEKTYKIQIFALNKILNSNSSSFKGLKDTYYIKSGNLYKYYYGEYQSLEEALKELPNIKKKFKDAFIINSEKLQK